MFGGVLTTRPNFVGRHPGDAVVVRSPGDLSYEQVRSPVLPTPSGLDPT